MKSFATLFLLLVLLAISSFSHFSFAEATNYADPSFRKVWEQADKPVRDVGNVGRGYTWGPRVQNSEAVTNEPYNGGTRTVQYFDKARMEINAADPNPNDLWHVTTGLLVKELVTGARQDQDNFFINQQPSTVQVAGDPNTNGQNALAPTYASFANLVSATPDQNPQKPTIGSPITAKVDKNGTVSMITPPQQRLVSAYDSITQHNIPDVFVAYNTQNGRVWNGTRYVQGSVFYGNVLYVLGRPITEAYWTRAILAGVERDILVQLFERRTLTYTPSNPDPYKVEMGNVGQHYYRWRYQQNAACTQLQPKLTFPTQTGDFPTDFSQYLPYNTSGPVPSGTGNDPTSPNIVRYPTGATAIYASPAISSDQNLAIVGTDGKGVVGLRLSQDIHNTCELWRYPQTETPPNFEGTPLLYNGVAYIGDTNGAMHAINMADGTAAWPQPVMITTGYPLSNFPITDGTNLYFEALDGRVYALSLHDGSVLWKSANPAIFPDLQGYITVHTDGPVFGFDRNLFFVGNDKKVYAYTRDGRSVAGWPSPNVGGFMMRTVFANNRLYVADGVTIFAFDRTGTIQATTAGIGDMAVANGWLYFVATPPQSKVQEIAIYRVSANDLRGMQLISYGDGSPIIANLTIMDGRLYLAGQTDMLLVDLTSPTPDPLARTVLANHGSNFRSSYGLTPVVAAGRVYVPNSDGTFNIIQ